VEYIPASNAEEISMKHSFMVDLIKRDVCDI
jgi:hypothetical protein